MPIQWIEHKGEKILHIDVANLANDHAALNTNLQTLTSLLKAEPRNSALALADLRNTNLSNNALMVLMRNAPFAAPYFRRSALIIEPNNARRILLDTRSTWSSNACPNASVTWNPPKPGWWATHPPTKYVSGADLYISCLLPSAFTFPAYRLKNSPEVNT